MSAETVAQEKDAPTVEQLKTRVADIERTIADLKGTPGQLTPELVEIFKGLKEGIDRGHDRKSIADAFDDLISGIGG